MPKNERLTHENLRGLFKSNFELAHFAINLARYNIRCGREITLEELFEQVRLNPSYSYLEELQKLENVDE